MRHATALYARAGRLGGVALLAVALSPHGLPAQQVAAAETRVPVAARDLPRGLPLESGDISYVSLGEAEVRGSGSPAAVGWITRRVVSAGEPLVEPTVAPPRLITSGETVAIVWQDGAVGLRLQGRAMNSASAGQRVTVRVDAKRRFEGVAIAPGVVRLNQTERSR